MILTPALMLLVPTYAGPGWQITVQTDKSNYHIGDEVYINGTLTYNAWPKQSVLVTITVKTPSGTLFYPPLPLTGEYGDYTANWTLGGANAKLGRWTVNASYGFPNETGNFVYTNTTDFQVVDIRITTSGDVEPADAPIARTGDIYTVTGNIAAAVNGNGIIIERSNMILDCAGYTLDGTYGGINGIDLTSVNNVTVMNLSIKSFDNGVYGYNCSHSRIAETNLSSNNNGIKCQYSDFNTIEGNTITKNAFAGIWLDLSQHNNISGNTLANNTVASNHVGGINLQDFSSYNSITGNNLVNNTWHCIYIQNSFSNNVFHNNFVNNTHYQAIVDGNTSDNVWDDGYPSGGNYWSDYMGFDGKRGPYQNETGSDGMGDTPYIIDVNNQDHYPLMKPFPWDQHDIGITSLRVLKTVVVQGYAANVSIMMFNYGQDTESFNVTAYANETMLIDTVSIELAGRASTTVNFTWNTTGFAKGNYTISAYAWPVQGETNAEDNTFIGDTVLVTIPGDINGDQYVNATDAVLLGSAFYPAGIYNPNADINGDGYCNAKDAVILGTCFGQH